MSNTEHKNQPQQKWSRQQIIAAVRSAGAFETSLPDILARVVAVEEGFPIHIGCGAEVYGDAIPDAPDLEIWRCCGCDDKTVPSHEVQQMESVTVEDLAHDCRRLLRAIGVGR
jgi:hypothetical protein